MLDVQKQRKLNSIIDQMQMSGYPKETIKMVVQDFESRHDSDMTSSAVSTPEIGQPHFGIDPNLKFQPSVESAKTALKDTARFAGKTVGKALDVATKGGFLRQSMAAGERMKQESDPKARFKVAMEPLKGLAKAGAFMTAGDSAKIPMPNVPLSDDARALIEQDKLRLISKFDVDSWQYRNAKGVYEMAP